MVGDDAEFIRELFHEFLDDAPSLIAEMDRAVQAIAAAPLQRASHTLKSSAKMFGADELSDLCKQVEMLAKAGDVTAGAQLLEPVRKEYNRVEAAMHGHLDAIR